jgi:hypothetical protein
MSIPRSALVVLLIVLPAVLRSVQVEWNLVPIGALALFAGSYFRNRTLAFAVPLAAMALGDVLLGVVHRNPSFYTFHSLLPVVYGCYVVSVLMGIGLQRYWDRHESWDRPGEDRAGAGAEGPSRQSVLATRVLPIAGTTLAGSLLFFIVTNLGDWWLYYQHTSRALVNCYVSAIPFFRNTIFGDVAGAALLFGGWSLAGFNTGRVPESERA